MWVIDQRYFSLERHHRRQDIFKVTDAYEIFVTNW